MRTELKLFRVANHLTQEKMAERIGTSRTNYRAVESGERKGNADFWLDLQKEFNIPIDKLHELRTLEKEEVNNESE